MACNGGPRLRQAVDGSVAAKALRAIERAIGALHDFRKRFPWSSLCQARRKRETNVGVRLQRRAYTFDGDPASSIPIPAGEAEIPRYRVAPIRVPSAGACDSARKHRVAHAMAVRVIDLLEVVEIEDPES